MRDRRHVFNQSDFQSAVSQSSYRRLASRTGTVDINLYASHSAIYGYLSRVLRNGLSRERSRLLGTAKLHLARAGPRYRVTLRIGDSYYCVVEGSVYMCTALLDAALSHVAFLCRRCGLSCCCPYKPPYFFLRLTVFLGPLRVRAFCLVDCPLTGNPLRCLTPL